MLVIGRALMIEPKLMLLDEPSLGLAPIIVEEIFNIIQRINAEKGTSALLVEQNALAALELADYGYVMENGKVVLDGPAEKLRDNQDVQEFYLALAKWECRRATGTSSTINEENVAGLINPLRIIKTKGSVLHPDGGVRSTRLNCIRKPAWRTSMDMRKEVKELAKRREKALEMGGPEKVQRQHTQEN